MNRKFWSLVLSLILMSNGLTIGLASAERTQGVESSVTKQTNSSRISLGQMTGYEQEGSRVVFTTANGRMAVSFLQDDMVRVRMAKAGEDFAAEDTDSQAIDKQEDEYAAIDVSVSESSSSVTMASDGLTVVADKATLALSFYDEKGDLITKNSDQAMSYDKDGEGKTVGFVRDAAGEEEHFFGLGSGGEGDNGNILDWRDKTYELWLSDRNIHAITPLYYSTAGYAIYLHSAYHGEMSFQAEPYELHVDGGELDYYFFAGENIKEMLGDFTELSGYMNMPPKYALGLTLRGDGSWDGDQLIDFLRSFYDAGISVDTLGVEPGWQTKTYPCTYVWSDKFPDPEAFVSQVHSLGARVNLWEHPYVSPDSPISQSILPYSINGSMYNRSDWADGTMKYGFGGLIPDFTQTEAFEIYWQIHNQNLVSIGVDGYKIDETDGWSAPNDPSVVWPSGMQANEYHNLLGTLTTNRMHEKYKTEHNQRTYIFSRGNYTGMQRYATTAYTDYYGFSQFLCAVLAQSYSGTYFTPEIRTGSTSNNIDYMRRMQMMLLTPFAMFNEWHGGDSVLGRSQMVIDNAKKYVGLHYALIPYTYSLFWEQHNTGVTVVRPLMMEFWEDTNTYGINNQYMLGSALMAAPVDSTALYATRSIYLPAGCQWMDYNNGYVYEGGQTIQYTSHCSVLPLFVKVGSIIPKGGVGKNTQDTTDPNLYIDMYPAEEETTFTLFEDDGISYDYEQGAYCTTELSVQRSSGLLKAVVQERETPADATKTYRPASRSIILQLHYRGKPSEVKNNNSTLNEVSEEAFATASGGVWTYSEEDHVIYVKLYDNGRQNVVTASVPDEEPQPDEPPVAGLDGYVTYECENEANELEDGASVKKVSGASNGQIVTGIGGSSGGSLTMKVTVSEDGLYPVNIGFANRDTSRSCMVQINDSAAIEICFPSSGGSSTISILNVNLSLKAGENRLVFYTEEGAKAPDLDYLAVSKTTIEPNPEPEGTRYEAEDQSVLSTVDAKVNAFASGEKTVSGFGESTRYLMVALDSLEKMGPYQISLTYSNADSTPVSLYYKVNGTAVETPLILQSTASPNIFAAVDFNVYLNQGFNELSFYLDQDATSRMEIDYITVPGQTDEEAIAEDAAEVKELVKEIGKVTATNCEDKKEAIERAEAAYKAMKSRYGASKTQEALGDSLTQLERARTLYDFYTSDMVYGDVDGKPGVDASDALKVLQHSVDLTELTGKEADLADVNLDGKINASDALCILQFSVELISVLPVY